MHPSPRSNSMLLVKTPPAMPGQRIGLMGGSFNPPHEGHVAISQTALKRLNLDRLWWIVSPGNPLKDHAGLPPLKARIATSKALIGQNPRIVVTGFEADLGTSYTWATIEFLKRRYPLVHFVWIMGADNLAQFHQWRNWRRVAQSLPIAVIDRPGWHLGALASPSAVSLARWRVPASLTANLAIRKTPAWTFLPTRLSAASSTQIRRSADKHPMPTR